MKNHKLRLLRLSLRCSQQAAAKLAGLRRYRLSLIECGYAQPTQEEVKALKQTYKMVEEDSYKTPFYKIGGCL